MVDKTPQNNVTHLHAPRAETGQRNDFLAIAQKLINENAKPADAEVRDTQQTIMGNSNVQLSSHPTLRQSITGNFNIQIAASEAGLEQRLALLETFLKKPPCP